MKTADSDKVWLRFGKYTLERDREREGGRVKKREKLSRPPNRRLTAENYSTTTLANCDPSNETLVVNSGGYYVSVLSVFIIFPIENLINKLKPKSVFR